MIKAQSGEGINTEQEGYDRRPIASVVNDAVTSPSQALDREIRTLFEPRFGYDFGQVRVHNDSRASESAALVNAKAYTVGQDIVFGEGEYTPTSSEGQRLLAHELTHIIQQGSRTAPQSSLMAGELTVSDPSDAVELAAEATANEVMTGESVAHTLPSRQSGHAVENTTLSAPAATRVQRQPVTLPETTITGAADPAAYNQGYAEGQTCGDHPRPHLSGKSMDSYNEGFSDAQSEHPCPYTGPTIGPDLGTGTPVPECSPLEEFMGLCNEKPDEPHIEPPELPEPVFD